MPYRINEDVLNVINPRIVPIQGDSKGPRVKNWPSIQTRAEDAIQANGGCLEFDSPDHHRYGCIIDEGMCVIDVDVHSGQANGYESLERLSADSGVDIAGMAAFVTASPSGGVHMWFKTDAQMPKSCSKYPSLDFLQVGAQVIGAGSTHVNGGIYEVQKGDEPNYLPTEVINCLIADAPAANTNDVELPAATVNANDDDSPWSMFNTSKDAVTRMVGFLEADGYTVKPNGDHYTFIRPNKTDFSQFGISGTIGRVNKLGNYYLHNFSTNDPNFECGSLNLSQAFKTLFRLDASEVNAQLRGLGFGSDTRKEFSLEQVCKDSGISSIWLRGLKYFVGGEEAAISWAEDCDTESSWSPEWPPEWYHTPDRQDCDTPEVTDAPEIDTTDAEALPESIYKGSGLIESVMNDFKKRTGRTSRELELSTAISLVSSCAARRVVDDSPHETTLNLYSVILGASGAGKDAPRAYIKDMLTAARPKAVGPDALTSCAGVIEHLTSRPVQTFCVDEMANSLEALMGGSKSSWNQDAILFIKNAFTNAKDKSFVPRLIRKGAGGNDFTLVQPHLSLFGFSTPRAFFNAFPEPQQIDGTLGRFIIWELGDTERRRISRKIALQTGLIEQLKVVSGQDGSLGAATGDVSEVTLETIRRTDDAIELLEQYYEDTGLQADKLEDTCSRSAAIWRRSPDKCARFALVFAISRTKSTNCEITVADAQRAIALTDFLMKRMVSRASEYSQASRDIELMQRILTHVPAGGKSITYRELSRKMQSMPKRQLMPLLEALGPRGSGYIDFVQKGRSEAYSCDIPMAKRKKLFGA